MALNGSLTTSAWHADDGTTRTYTLSWTAKQSVADNTSTITWVLKSSGSYAYGVAERTLTAVIAGKTVFSKTDRVMRSAGETIKTGTIVLEHNSDGSKSFSASINAAVYYSTVNCTGSKTFTLNKIARQSSFGTITGNTIGSSMTVNITRQVSTHTHQFWYKLGNSEWYDLGKGHGTSVKFTPDMALCSQIPNATSGTLELCIRTHDSNGNQIGSDVYKNVTVYVPSSGDNAVVPTVSLSVNDSMRHLSTYGGYVQGKSKFKITVTAAGSYGSTIKSYSTTVDGKTYTDATIETDAIVNSGTLTIKTTVTDSRGRTATASKTVTVLAYAAPKISALTIKRCNSDGSSNSKGAYLAVVFSAVITSLNNKNSAAYKVQYKKVSESSYTTKTATAYAGTYSVSNGTYIFAADTASSYDIIFIASDDFSDTNKAGTGSAESKFLSILRSKFGAALGKIAEFEGVFEIAWKTRFTGGFDVILLTDGTDLDTLTTPNKYWLLESRTYVNAPEEYGAILEIDSSGGTTIRQRFSVISKTKPRTYERAYYSGAWGEWVEHVRPYFDGKSVAIGKLVSEIKDTDTGVALTNGAEKNIGSARAVVDNDYYTTTTGSDASITVKKAGLYSISAHAYVNLGASTSQGNVSLIVYKDDERIDDICIYTYSTFACRLQTSGTFYLPAGVKLIAKIKPSGSTTGTMSFKGGDLCVIKMD